ncbi:hypothetical protein JS531_08710 [Bifidobacterium sp. CP2]|uniref:hypothetical protein n=1 Tax=Bifidobacterium sp. CP2 TaxID=2809025 RepID=UPI001BDD867A|nr:hypothetical protein [Bifidobacterium sp. CP2]MBT1182021.1 hypothetical protein [Bifidobacterium sp. CP2]
MSRRKKGTDDWDKSKTRYYIDEYFGETRHKPKRQFGPKAIGFIAARIQAGYNKYGPTLPEGAPTSPDDCMNAFWEKKAAYLHKKMHTSGMRSDQSFESCVTKTINGWFLNLYAETVSGRMREVVRGRLSKAKDRFTNDNPQHYWGLVEGPDTPSAAREMDLHKVVSQYPIDIDLERLMDPNRKRNVNYGATGQMENLLAGVLETADGTLPLDMLFHLVQYRLPMLAETTLVDITDEDGNPMDIADDATSAEDIVIEAMTDDARERQIRYILSLLEEHEHDRQWVRRYISKHLEVRRMLLDLGIDPDERKA